MLSYSELTKAERKAICNGCGGKGGLIDPPEFLFHASCNQHDFYYWRGGNELNREAADESFYRYMKKDAAEAHWSKKWFFYSMAWAYYRAVRIAGNKFFHYGEMRTKADLREAILRGAT